MIKHRTQCLPIFDLSAELASDCSDAVGTTNSAGDKSACQSYGDGSTASVTKESPETQRAPVARSCEANPKEPANDSGQSESQVTLQPPVATGGTAEVRNKKLDNLSKTLAKIAKDLDGADGDGETQQRDKVVSAVTHLSRDRYELGKQLVTYRTFFKADRKWTAVCKAIATALKVEARTVRRIIEDYNRASIVSGPERTAAKKLNIRLEAKKHKDLVDRLVQMQESEGPPQNEEKAEARVKQAADAVKGKTSADKKGHSGFTHEQQQVFNLYRACRGAMDQIPVKDRVIRLREALQYILCSYQLKEVLQVSPATELPVWLMTGAAPTEERKAA